MAQLNTLRPPLELQYQLNFLLSLKILKTKAYPETICDIRQKALYFQLKILRVGVCSTTGMGGYSSLLLLAENNFPHRIPDPQRSNPIEMNLWLS